MVNEIKTAAAILALIRGDVTASCVADDFGVTEAQVHRWKDIFQVAGILALTKALKRSPIESECDEPGEPTTRQPSRPHVHGVNEPTTKPPSIGFGNPGERTIHSPKRKRR